MKVVAITVLMMVPAAAMGQAIMPGQWDIAVTTDSISMPDMPAEVAASMRGKTIHVKHCITPAEAARGPQEMLKSGNQCSFTKYTMFGGKLHSEISCKQPGGTMTGVSDGSFTPTGFTAKGRTVMTGQTTMTLTATTVGTRTGPCAK